MQKFLTSFKQNFWPISALLFCPCHLPLSMAAVVSLTAGTTVGAYISTHYSSIEAILAIIFSFYFVLAFMIWVVRGPQSVEGQACAVNEKGKPCPDGLSTRQIIVWGIIAIFTMPALIAISTFTKQETSFVDTINQIFANTDVVNSGFIWLVSLATVVMIPVMLIWLVWMWIAWSKADFVQSDPENWNYEYE